MHLNLFTIITSIKEGGGDAVGRVCLFVSLFGHFCVHLRFNTEEPVVKVETWKCWNCTFRFEPMFVIIVPSRCL